VEAQIARLTGLRFRMLRFSPVLEQKYERETGRQRCYRFWLEGLLATILYVVASCTEQYFAHQRSMHSFLLVMSFTAGAALAVNTSMLLCPPTFYREASAALYGCMLASVELVLRSNHSAMQSAYAQFLVVSVVVFTNTVLRIQFSFAASTTGFCIVADVLFLYADRMLSAEGKVLGLSLTVSTLLLTVIANYSLNRAERQSFLLCLRGDLLIGKLERANDELALAARTDGLTQLANRRAFDERFAEAWASAREDGSVISVIVVDIDHFKRLNDRYGHLYGDKVLKRVAHLLGEALRRKEDLAARFGGEEFVILLPATTRDCAAIVAERLRRLVEIAGFPATESSDESMRGISATVSCGVATASPLVADGQSALLQAADEALYHAKELGRNMVAMADGTHGIRALPRAS
jgi:diguanylate cyclase (GGDEF)-like protein